MKHFYAILLIVVLFVSGCQPSETAIQTALAQTQAANPTSTFTPIPSTETPTTTPTATSTATSTETPTITPSPTPDLRVIQLDPKEFLLQKLDLPLDAKYYLPGPGWTDPVTNEEIVGGWTVEKGRAYLAETGRINGWEIDYKRGSNIVIAPEEIYNEAVLFKTTAGAQIVITKYDDRYITEYGYTEVPNPPEIGDTTRVFIYKKMQSSGEYRIWYEIDFSYLNYVQVVTGYGWEHEVKPEYVENIARILLAKLQAAPLSNP
jgi:hypothetical protein